MKKDNKDNAKGIAVSIYNDINDVVASLSVFVASNETRNLLNNIKISNEAFYKKEVNNIEKLVDKDENDNNN